MKSVTDKTIKCAILVLALVAAALPVSGKAAPAQLAPDLEALKRYSAPASQVEQNEQVTAIRAANLRDAALSVGAHGGLVHQSKNLVESFEKRATYLDKIFQFSALMLRDQVFPPVILEAKDALVQNEANLLHIGGTVYRIDKAERFISVIPSWRSYLYIGLLMDETIEAPPPARLPRNDIERQVWASAVEEGWLAGVEQANDAFRANVQRLRRDFEGMALYRILLYQGMISETRVASSRKEASGNDTELIVNDTVYMITDNSKLIPNAKKWKPRTTVK